MPVFYDENALKRTAVNDQHEPGLDFWPCGTHKPFMFLDIVGTESQSPYIKDGPAPAIFNMDEVNATVCSNIPAVLCLKFDLKD